MIPVDENYWDFFFYSDYTEHFGKSGVTKLSPCFFFPSPCVVIKNNKGF